MKRLVIINGTVIFLERISERMAIICVGDKIENILPMTDLQLLEGDTVVDAQDNYVSPGFIDIHTHGGGGHDFMDATIEAYIGAAETHAKFGTTALLPTTLTSTTEELMKTFSIYKEAVKQNKKGAKFLGLHLEGPYFSHNQRGAQDPKYIRNPDPKEYEYILDSSDDITRWSIAPELPRALEFGKRLVSKGILPSIAHSDAIYEEVEQAYNLGFTHITHLYSATSTITRRNAFRFAGIIEAAYLINNMTVEIIADGVHLPKSLLQFVYKFKGADQTALCTDSMRGAGMPDGDSILGSLDKGQRVIIEDGVAKIPDKSSFAGSVATADRLVRTMINVAEVPLVDTIKMMTINPAKIMRINQIKGSLAIGKYADIVIFDKNISVLYTIIEGRIIHKK